VTAHNAAVPRTYHFNLETPVACIHTLLCAEADHGSPCRPVVSGPAGGYDRDVASQDSVRTAESSVLPAAGSGRGRHPKCEVGAGATAGICEVTRRDAVTGTPSGQQGPTSFPSSCLTSSAGRRDPLGSALSRCGGCTLRDRVKSKARLAPALRPQRNRTRRAAILGGVK